MACTSDCQSNCYKDQEEEEEEEEQVKVNCNNSSVRQRNNNYNNNNMNNNMNNMNMKGLCLKCKSNPPISSNDNTESDDCRFCIDCFRSNLFAKFRFAVTSNAMISPSDSVLLAFSGGTSSRVALQFLHEMHDKAQKNFDASRDRSLPVFRVGVAFIDETSVHSLTPNEAHIAAVQDIRLIVQNLAPPSKQLHLVPIESVYSSHPGDHQDARERLTKLLQAVTDPTGKQDLLLHLRMLALQKIAAQNGYNRLLLGSCISRIACHVITATVKGQGYSLPADIQYVDARWEIPVLLPLRDCLAQELNMLCRLDGLKTVDFRKSPCTGINGLVSSFVSLLQEENPSRECTIVRTAGKLIPFHFNRIQEIDDSEVPLATRRRQKRYNLKPNESLSSESFCFICNGPLSKSDLLILHNLEQCQTSPDIFGADSCLSCRFQILPQDPALLDQFSDVLPQQLVARAKHDKFDKYRALREQIQDCLLLEGEDET